MNKHMLQAGTLLLVFLASGTALADNAFGLGTKAGTLGIGLEGTWRPIPWIDFRVGYTALDFDTTRNESGIEYDATLALDNTYGTANIHFPVSPMRLTVGAFTNSNELQLASTEGNTFDIGSTSYSAAEVGSLQSTASFSGVTPYLGVGFDFTLFDRTGLNLDFGVLWQGEPTVSLDATGPIAGDPTFQTELEAERRDLEAEFKDYKAYPLISLGIFYNF